MPREKVVMPQRSAELVDVAARLFRERGYDATSVQEIADEMGILKGSVYHYVKSKEDLLWMVVEPPFSDLVGQAEDILFNEDKPIKERLAEAMVAHAASFEAHFPHMFVMARENGETLSEKRRADLEYLKRTYFQAWSRALVEGQSAGEIRGDVSPSMAVHAIFGMLNWMFQWFRLGARYSAAEVAEQFSIVALEGLSAGDRVGSPVRLA